MFDRFIFVDWSAQSEPATGADSIWIAEWSAGAEIALKNPLTRDAATRAVLKSLRRAVSLGQRVLVGFDFAYCWPQAVLQRSANNGGPAHFAELWNALHERIHDGAANQNDRYTFAAWANECWLKEHYFWGVPSAKLSHPWLKATKTATNLPEFRLTESRSPGAQPTRKLAYPGSVGSQTLLGLRRLHALRTDPTLASVSRVWPMETGFSLPPAPAGQTLIVHAEIYPTPVLSMANSAGIRMPTEVMGMVNDARQVWACAALARHEDAAGLLVSRFGKPASLGEEYLGQAREEGWILWA